MKLNAEQIKKALECWSKNFDGKVTDLVSLCNALALINSQEQKIKELTEENERLRAEEKQSQILIKTLHDKLDEGYAKFVDEERADIVRKMHSEIKDRCIKGGIYPAFVARTIDQIAKEISEGI